MKKHSSHHDFVPHRSFNFILYTTQDFQPTSRILAKSAIEGIWIARQWLQMARQARLIGIWNKLQKNF